MEKSNTIQKKNRNRGIGCGGIDCPCCTDLNSKKKLKRKLNRQFRKAGKLIEFNA
jgi:hypothetical protein